MSLTNIHAEWLSLVDISGPFLAIPVLTHTFPQGLEELSSFKHRRLRQAYDEWREALELEDPQLEELHSAWIDEVLSLVLEFDDDGKGDVLKRAEWCGSHLKSLLPDQGVVQYPDLAVIDEQQDNKPLLLIHTYKPNVDLESTVKQEGWITTPADRMVQLCRSLDCRLGLVTNGERWMLVDAPVGAVTSFSSWYARLWSLEPITLQAFVHLLGIRRFFVDETEQLPALFDASLEYQDDVTDALGEQVCRAVEVLIQSLDKADQDRNRELLCDVSESELYEAALTVMMRLVFLLSAEERGLLLLGDECYESNYAISTLRMQLRQEPSEILERRWDAWTRLLATFRAVYYGIEHENLRLPALGSSLFDPDHFPFLEGRAKESNWKNDTAVPLPIDNRTVLLLLEAIQVFQGRTLSYRALDVEQIGYVYEGLLERTVRRADEVTLELNATRKAQSPWVTLDELDSVNVDGTEQLITLLHERSGCSISRIRKDLSKLVDENLAERLLITCQGDIKLRDRIKPFAHLLRTDPWGYPLVYPAGSFIVTSGSNRRETGTHYTPKSLTEEIVTQTLTPLSYIGPVEGIPREKWQLKSSTELLELKICDPAMGSGAFLVQACRWLAERLVEAWSFAEESGNIVSVDGNVLNALTTKEPMPRDTDARILIARRLIAERCLYGVDLNPLAVELAKLSIWLITLTKGQPFGFLDHNLRCGDSLLGIHQLTQLTKLPLNQVSRDQQLLFGQTIEHAIKEAVELRHQLRHMSTRNISDIKTMSYLYFDAHSKLGLSESLANIYIGTILAKLNNNEEQAKTLTTLYDEIEQNIKNINRENLCNASEIIQSLNHDILKKYQGRNFLHWPLHFPEVFFRKNGGFDALIGNPPFIGGRRMRSTLGSEFLSWLNYRWPHASLNSDFCIFFYLQSADLLRENGCLGFIGTKTIGQGDTARTGLGHIRQQCGFDILYARPSFYWPGSAAVVAALVILYKGQWNGIKLLDGKKVNFISEVLDDQEGWGEALRLQANISKSFQGSVLVGLGFVLMPTEAQEFIKQRKANSEVIKPYLGGEDLNTNPEQTASRWAIDFRDASLEKCKERWPELLGRVQQLVKPQRDKTRRDSHRKYWWQHGDKRPALYSCIQEKKEVFVIARVTKYVAIISVSANQIFHDKVYVFDLPHWSSFSVLQSSFHDIWVRRGSSTVGETLNYTPSDYFDTFPFLHIRNDEIDKIGKHYHALRKSIMIQQNYGLTDLYNHFHDELNINSDIEELRNLQVKMDIAVADAYGWNSINLEHGFRETKQGQRFTISKRAKRDILQLLLTLNHKQADHEVNYTQNVKHHSSKKISVYKN